MRKKNGMRTLAKEKKELPPILDRELTNYLDATFPDKESPSRYLCEYAFKHWQLYLNEYSKHNQPINEYDITTFNSMLLERELKPITIYNCYGQLERFFRQKKLKKVAEYVKELKMKNKSKAGKNYYPLRSVDIKDLFEVAEQENKLLFRILLTENLLKKEIPNIEVTFDYKAMEKKFSVNGKNLIHKETINAANDWLNSDIWQNSRKRKDGRLFRFQRDRTIDEKLDKLENDLFDQKRRILDYPLFAKSIQLYGRGMHYDDLKEWLSDGSKKDTCPRCGRKYAE